MTTLNCDFQITFSKNGNLLAVTELTADKDAVIELTDAVNRQCRDIRATIQTRGNGRVDLDRPITVKG